MSEVLIVTGGSSGIGAATAVRAAERGYSVVLSYLQNRGGAESVAAKIRDHGGTALMVKADVAVESDVVRLFETVDRELGRVDILINNAGIVDRQARLETMSEARLQRMFRTNVIGSMLCAREAVRRMSKQRFGRGGTIVNVSSTAVKHGAPGEYVDYAAAKAAIDVFTIGLAREVASEGIRVNAVRPGIIDTGIHAKGGEPGRVERVKASLPMQRAGTADEVAAAILWLVSPEAAYCTGAILDVSGGR